jgi:hypothetical protein
MNKYANCILNLELIFEGATRAIQHKIKRKQGEIADTDDGSSLFMNLNDIK